MRSSPEFDFDDLDGGGKIPAEVRFARGMAAYKSDAAYIVALILEGKARGFPASVAGFPAACDFFTAHSAPCAHAAP